jgi:hypothetical protein
MVLQVVAVAVGPTENEFQEVFGVRPDQNQEGLEERACRALRVLFYVKRSQHCLRRDSLGRMPR